jgi:hypothetical protein
VPGICKMLKDAVPLIVNGIASKIPSYKKKKKNKNLKIFSSGF